MNTILTGAQTMPFADGKTLHDIFLEYVPGATDEEIDLVMWTFTGWPAFFEDGENTLRAQLNLYAARKRHGALWIYEEEDRRAKALLNAVTTYRACCEEAANHRLLTKDPYP